MMGDGGIWDDMGGDGGGAMGRPGNPGDAPGVSMGIMGYPGMAGKHRSRGGGLAPCTHGSSISPGIPRGPPGPHGTSWDPRNSMGLPHPGGLTSQRDVGGDDG